MHVVITGANGFVGQNLVSRLLADPRALPGWSRLTLLDLAFEQPLLDPRVRCLEGDLNDPALIADMLDEPVAVLFHLGSVPGGLAEREYELGRRVNLDATLALFEALRSQEHPARVVFASTIAVYGALPEGPMDESAPLLPQLSYGTQKLIGELLLEDFSRRGELDGIALRLPGIVARPPQPSGLLSAFMSDLFWRLRDGQPFVCPVSPQGTAWWMSVARCVDNLLHAARQPAASLPGHRTITLPVLHLSVAAVVEGLCQRYGEDRQQLVSYRPDPALEQAFAKYPALATPVAERLGFAHDGDLAGLIARTLDG